MSGAKPNYIYPTVEIFSHIRSKSNSETVKQATIRLDQYLMAIYGMTLFKYTAIQPSFT